jgi:hypothetical protein
MELKIKKTMKGTYCIPSFSIKELRKLNELKNHSRKWTLAKDESRLFLE